jgi:hypothetical protein
MGLELSGSAGMLYKTLSAAVSGIDASIIEVDVSGIKTNEDYFHTVGLPCSARTDRERLEDRYQHGLELPLRKSSLRSYVTCLPKLQDVPSVGGRGFRKSKGICTPTSGMVRKIGGTALCINGTRDHVHLLIRMSTHHSIADIAQSDKNEFVEVGARALARTPSFCLANRLRRVHRERVGCRCASGLYFKPAGASQGKVVSRGVF